MGYTYPALKTSASLRKAELMRIGNGYFSKSLGNRTTDSHWTPTFIDRRPENLREYSSFKQYEFSTKYILMDSSTVICWMSPFVILGGSGLFYFFYSSFDGKSC